MLARSLISTGPPGRLAPLIGFKGTCEPGDDFLCFAQERASLKFAILNPKNGFTVLIPRAENQIDYHTCNSFTFKRLPKPGGLSAAVKTTKLYKSVKPFPDRQSPNLSDAQESWRWILKWRQLLCHVFPRPFQPIVECFAAHS